MHGALEKEMGDQHKELIKLQSNLDATNANNAAEAKEIEKLRENLAELKVANFAINVYVCGRVSILVVVSERTEQERRQIRKGAALIR